ncbi:MAG: 2Fe-2S iron-sulfur cluster-binding protein [Ilumatobacteraceae bacterium]
MADDRSIEFVVDGTTVSVPGEGSLLDALRETVGRRSVKDGCSPQGQCGCCTVWVDGAPRVACVTPVNRVRGRTVTTVQGLPGVDRWCDAFVGAGASQCGFCTPGIVMRLAALDADTRRDRAAVRRSLLAHVCRCTGWNSVVDAARLVEDGPAAGVIGSRRDPGAAERRAELEGGVPQRVGREVVVGAGGFADDEVPPDALVGQRGPDGEWVLAPTLAAARASSGKVQGRRTTAPLRWPIDVPDGDWVRTLRTTWVEPGYLEPDATWCVPGGVPASTRGNGGAFGAKSSDELGALARRLADEHGRPVRLVMSREDVVRSGPKRPPMAIGVRADGSGVVRVARTDGIAAVIRSAAPMIDVVEVDVPGPPTSTSVRAAGWAEVLAVLATLDDGPTCVVTGPSGGTAEAVVSADGAIRVSVRCGTVLDDVVLRSYCVGAAHMAFGWVTSEAISVSDDGEPLDLTMRSFGIVRAVDTPVIDVEVGADDGPPVNGSDAVFAAVAAAVWRAEGLVSHWPTRRGSTDRPR